MTYTSFFDIKNDESSAILNSSQLMHSIFIQRRKMLLFVNNAEIKLYVYNSIYYDMRFQLAKFRTILLFCYLS